MTLRITASTKRFWQAVVEGGLLLQVSPDTGRPQFFPRPVNVEAPESVTWQTASGRGTLLAFTVCRVPGPGFEAEVPYVMGIVRLAEGPRVLSRIIDHEGSNTDKLAARLKVGMPLSLCWSTRGANGKVYAFEPNDTTTSDNTRP